MRLEVLFTPAGLAPAEVTGRTVFVIDVLRTTTVICAALYHGARAVVPVASVEEASRLAQTLGPDAAVLVGERNGEPIAGFHLGNSPLEVTEQVVRGKTLVLTTTNGTGALLATQGAAEVYVMAAVNLSVAAARAREILHERKDLMILCAGREFRFGLDDAYAAGRLAVLALGGGRRRKGLNDAALVAVDLARRYPNWDRPLTRSAAGRHLGHLGRRDDVVEAGREDGYPVLPILRDRRITLESPAGGAAAA
ncbi:MAG: 2-phosphosulfolactate phosphatase [Gemmatimonadales bacterium]